MKTTLLPTTLSPAVREFLDGLADLIVDDILEENDRVQDEFAATPRQDAQGC
jgi:hypothetical protein